MPTMTLEGTWEEIARHADELAGKRVRLILLDEEPPFNGGRKRGTPLTCGMFPELLALTDEDFRSAEWR